MKNLKYKGKLFPTKRKKKRRKPKEIIRKKQLIDLFDRQKNPGKNFVSNILSEFLNMR